MSSTKRSPLEALIIILTLEKSAQHLLTALFFVDDVPGIGKPDIGPNFNISSEVMALLNLVLFGTFFTGSLRQNQGRWMGVEAYLGLSRPGHCP